MRIHGSLKYTAFVIQGRISRALSSYDIALVGELQSHCTLVYKYILLRMQGMVSSEKRGRWHRAFLPSIPK